MKKILILMLILVMTFSLVACGEKETVKPQGESSVIYVPNQNGNTTEPSNDSDKVEPVKVDIDLTKLSKTMVYSEVFNMLYTPDEYIGKMVRMKGQFVVTQAVTRDGEPIPGQYYFACLIADATACCTQGLEFVLKGDYTYPGDYPKIGTELVVSGRFETYDEYGHIYCHLVDAVME